MNETMVVSVKKQHPYDVFCGRAGISICDVGPGRLEAPFDGPPNSGSRSADRHSRPEHPAGDTRSG